MIDQLFAMFACIHVFVSNKFCQYVGVSVMKHKWETFYEKCLFNFIIFKHLIFAKLLHLMMDLSQYRNGFCRNATLPLQLSSNFLCVLRVSFKIVLRYIVSPFLWQNPQNPFYVHFFTLQLLLNYHTFKTVAVISVNRDEALSCETFYEKDLIS